MKTGVDIVNSLRIKKILDNKSAGFYRRVFTLKEIEYIEYKNHDYKTVAGLFASKEAVSKVLGTGIGIIGLKDIEILHYEKGKPYVVLNDKLMEGLNRIGLNAIDISISHDGDYSIAFAAGYREERKYEISQEIRGLLPVRKADSHKGNYGRIGIIGGSKGMTGAPYLASMGALKSGAGLVYTVVPDDIHDIMCIKSNETIVRSYDDTEECLDSLQDLDGIVLGPGLGSGEKSRLLVKHILDSFHKPVVLDADGINAVDDYNILWDRKGLTVITPHPGELSRLIGKEIKEIQNNRIYYSKYTAEKYNVITVLKGDKTVVADTENIYVNNTGNPGMATAGSGDVLAGVIISLICQGIQAFDAGKIGVYTHGLAGDMAKDLIGEYGITASDILNHIPLAINRIMD